MSEKIKVTTGASGKLKIKTTKTTKPKVVAKSAKPAAPKLDSPKLATVSGTNSKETLYVDVDDEITAIIEKVQRAKGGIIALVLPKRATVMQSIVNMKLLKRTADTAGKNLVLVTSETSLLPLAGLVGLYIAETPSSKPAIPPAPDQPSDEPESVDEPIAIADNSGAPSDDFDPDVEANTPVGQLAGTMPVAAPGNSVEEVIIDDAADDAITDADQAKPDVTPVKRNKKLAIPNFDTFRLRIVFGFLLLALLVTGWIFATRVLPKATVAIETNSQLVRSNLNVTLDTAAKAIDTTNKIIPATAQSTSKAYTQQVATTGQQNNGEKSSGSFTVVNCTDSSITVSGGQSVVSAGRTYIIQSTETIPASNFFSNGKCKNDGKAAVDITALKGGAEYNVSGATFSNSSVSGTGTTSGGTDNIVKVVAQSDIDTAKAKIAAQDTTAIKQSLQNALKTKGLMAVTSTFLPGDQQLTTSANAGDQAETLTVTATVPYTMLGIKQADLQALVVANVKSQIDTKNQKILDDGTAKATFTQQSPGSATSAVVGVATQSIAGPELNINSIKQQVAGKKTGDVQQALGGLPGVTNVKVSYSPFWVSSAPKDTAKITIEVAKPSGS